MVSSSINHSPSLKPFAHVFKDLITIEEIKTYKPSCKVYEYLARRVGKGDIWLVSGNAFDVVGARAAGLKAVWVDRGGEGWRDGLGGLVDGGGGPTVVVRGVDEVVGAIRKFEADD